MKKAGSHGAGLFCMWALPTPAKGLEPFDPLHEAKEASLLAGSGAAPRVP